MRDFIIFVLAILFAIFIIQSKPAKSSEKMEEIVAYVGLGFAILSLIKPEEEKEKLPNVIRPPEPKVESSPPPVEHPPQKKFVKEKEIPGTPTKYFVPKYLPNYGR